MMESLKAESGGRLGPVLLPDEERRPFLEHLEELRRRVLRSFLWVGAAAVLAFRFSGEILNWLIRPVGKVVFLSPAEPFMIHLKVAFLGGLLLALPLLAWEVWGFLSPALFPDQRRPVLFLVPVSVGLFASGAWFTWAVLLPAALRFFLSFSSENLTPMVTVGSYVGFVGWFLLAGGLAFQMPMIVMLLAKLRLIRPAALLRQWRIALVGILIAAAVLTPTPDIATQLLLAGPMCALYLVSIGLAALVNR
ncbi:MAG: twin-arginine translocase subunit TatC [Candidatus Omnitrophica bacterium]|nr:twin-arginine translocase subunit TatC [Candidatus Omnitrophota bacterium]